MKVYNENTLVELSNSILKHFGANTFHETNKIIDQEIKGYKKVVVVLFDGMGQNIVRKHLKEKSFIRSHYATTINSIFPPTTAAATTSLLTGKYPIENGWLGWTEYFKQYDRNIILFRGIDYNTGEELNKPGETNIANAIFPIEYIFDLIEQANPKAKAINISRYPIQKDGPKSLKKGADRLCDTLKENQECFIYYYWDSPDYEMHSYGIEHRKVKREVHKAEKFMRRAIKNNKDTVFILLADHGHINVTFLDMCEHNDIYSLLSKPITLEKRTPSFFVKSGKEAEFAALFDKYYGNSFELITKEEAIKMQLFGKGKPAEGVYDTFGDFVAVAKKEFAIFASKELSFIDNFKGHHAGGTDEERLIDVSIFKN